jgi:hypothetical protein
VSAQENVRIAPANGKLGVLTPGMGGAVTTTFIAGLEAVWVLGETLITHLVPEYYD